MLLPAPPFRRKWRSTLVNRRLLVSLCRLFAALALLAATSGCVDSRCTRNAECPVGQVCVTATGACEAPACTSDAECADDQRCFANHCVPRDESCDCAQAPTFCGVDLNPLSPSGGHPVCVPGAFDQGAMLFFGSVLCSHCQALLDALEVLQAEVLPGGSAPLIFVQEPSIEVSGQVVEGALAGSAVAVVQDDASLGIWSAYAADWYHVVLIDRNGCQARHWGPLIASDVTDNLHHEMRTEWLKAQEVSCTPTPPDAVEVLPDLVEPAPEVVPEVQIDVPADLSTDLPPDPGPVDVSVEAVADTPAVADIAAEAVAEVTPDPVGDALPEAIGDALPELLPEPAPEVADVSEAAGPGEVDLWVEPYQLQDLCQVEPGLPAPVGAPVPHFLCKDRNPSSLLLGGAVSDLTLREQVWIAYFGTCT